ncbi:replication endonuclease [Cupriavidus oxalaticus]|uniref:replication endonuclease n=1 Tax=Cupriavidus oxalaticus TaxID=96344 RepID=UPI004034F227
MARWVYEHEASDELAASVPAMLARARMPARWYHRAMRDAIKANRVVDPACMVEMEAAESAVAAFMAEHAPDGMPVPPAASHWDICDKARLIAGDMVLKSAGLSTDDALVVAKQACEFHGVALPDVKVPKREGQTDEQRETAIAAGIVARVRCEKWWRRRLSVKHGRAVEHSNIKLRYVHARAEPYASNETVRRRIAQNKRNAETLASVTMENENGDRFTLEELAARSVSNKALRRGEFMLRLRGMEDLAHAAGFQAVFFTITCPSRFHAVKHGTFKANPRYDPSLSPRDANDYLVDVWALIRSKLDRLGITRFGMRVAEPHHDSCPHWHGIIFSDRVEEACAVIREYALRDSPDEKGAQIRRVKFDPIVPAKGSAVAYVAKYISKNIDGHGVGDHKTVDGFVVVNDLLGDTEITPSQRVEAWSTRWGIRQFQPFGGARVGVWRELRRVKEEDLPSADESPEILRAWLAAQKTDDKRADWAEFCKAMGGVAGEAGRIRIRYTERMEPGRYGLTLRKVPHGVEAIGRAHIVDGIADYWRAAPIFVPATRYQWRVVERSGAAASTRTRVNNCTQVSRKQDGDSRPRQAEGYKLQGNWSSDVAKLLREAVTAPDGAQT